MRLAEEMLARLRFSNDDAAQILALIKNHMRFGDILEMKQSTLKRFLRLPRFDEHLELHRLDVASAHGDFTLYDFARAQFEAEPAAELAAGAAADRPGGPDCRGLPAVAAVQTHAGAGGRRAAGRHG